MNLDPTKVYSIHKFDDKEETFFDESEAIRQLLYEDVLFPNYRNYSHSPDLNGKDFTNDGRTIVLYVNCNDVFVWGCADAEDVGSEEQLKNLYDLCVKYGPFWGSVIWVCLKRKEKPQAPVARRLKENNCWIEELDKLADNGYDKMLSERDQKS